MSSWLDDAESGLSCASSRLVDPRSSLSGRSFCYADTVPRPVAPLSRLSHLVYSSVVPFPKQASLLLTLAGIFTGLLIALPRPARAFGDAGAFDPRVLLTGNQTSAARPSAPARWSWELVQRTSAPARLHPTTIHAEDPAVVDAPFLYWSGDADVAPLTDAEVTGLRRFFALGGVMLVDDAAPGPHAEPSAFAKSARREIARILPDSTPISLGVDHVVLRSFYLLRRAEGRIEGPPALDGIVRGGQAQVLFSEHDLGGALARTATGVWEQTVTPGGDMQRERAIRLAVNIAMYVLCSNYKDDQVHAPFLMRRRAMSAP
jgi:hypothetical protein